MLPEIIEALLSSPAFRVLVEDMTLAIISDVFHRRRADPEFQKASDAAFEQLAAAKTSDETKDAQNALRALMARN